MKRLALVLCLMLPSWAVGQTKVEDLSPREQAAHLIGTCSAFIDYGRRHEVVTLFPTWSEYEPQITEMINLLVEQSWTDADTKISEPARRDMLAKIITGEIRHTERFYAKCLVGLKNVIKNQYEPNGGHRGRARPSDFSVLRPSSI